MKIELRDTVLIRGNSLRVGMRTVVDGGHGLIIDEILTEFVYHRSACRGRHFRAADRRVICYEDCALVRILRV